ncbi:4060_t:CDS:1, partial [Gigaspora rosea]
SSAKPLKRQDSCTTTTVSLTTIETSSACTIYGVPTITAITCGTCDYSGSSAAAAAPAQLLKRQDSSCNTVMTTLSTIFTNNACTATWMAPTVTATRCGTC